MTQTSQPVQNSAAERSVHVAIELSKPRRKSDVKSTGDR